jgi:hypothetical protein
VPNQLVSRPSTYSSIPALVPPSPSGDSSFLNNKNWPWYIGYPSYPVWMLNTEIARERRSAAFSSLRILQTTSVTVVTCCDDTFIFRRCMHCHMLFMFDCSFYYVYHCYAKTLLLSLPSTQHYCYAISTFIYLFYFDIYSYALTYLWYLIFLHVSCWRIIDT